MGTPRLLGGDTWVQCVHLQKGLLGALTERLTNAQCTLRSSKCHHNWIPGRPSSLALPSPNCFLARPQHISAMLPLYLKIFQSYLIVIRAKFRELLNSFFKPILVSAGVLTHFLFTLLLRAVSCENLTCFLLSQFLSLHTWICCLKTSLLHQGFTRIHPAIPASDVSLQPPTKKLAWVIWF
jgi:hypothetical protein